MQHASQGKNAFKLQSENPKRRDYLGDLVIDVRIIL